MPGPAGDPSAVPVAVTGPGLMDPEVMAIFLTPPEPPWEAFGLQRCDGGYRVKTTPRGHVEVVRRIYNWRVCRTPLDHPMSYDRGWCYYGTGPASFTAAVLAAMAWDGGDDSEPQGWDKNAFTGQYREPREGR